MNQRLPGILLCTVLVLAAMCGCVSAVELTVGTPTASDTGDVFEIPVILKNDIDFAGFTCEVGNKVDGAVITISDEKPLKGFTYFPVGDVDGNKRIVAYSIGSTTDPELHLFTVKVQITDPSVTTIPLDISMRAVIQDDNTNYPLDEIITTGLSSIKLTDSISADVTTDAEERLIPELMSPAASVTATAVPTTAVRPETAGTPSPVPTSASSVTPSASSSPSGTSQPQATPAAQPVATAKASSPGFGIGLILAGLGTVAVLLKRKMS